MLWLIKALLIGHCTLEIYWQLLVKGKGVADCYCLLCICVICLLQIMCGNLVFVISCYNSAWCLVFVWLSSFLGGASGFKVRFGEHESWRSKEWLYEKVFNVVQEAKLSTWNLVVVYMWLLIIGLKFFWLSLQVRIVSSIDGGRMPLGSYLYVLVKLTTFHYAMSCDGGNKGSKIDYRGRD